MAKLQFVVCLLFGNRVPNKDETSQHLDGEFTPCGLFSNKEEPFFFLFGPPPKRIKRTL